MEFEGVPADRKLTISVDTGQQKRIPWLIVIVALAAAVFVVEGARACAHDTRWAWVWQVRAAGGEGAGGAGANGVAAGLGIRGGRTLCVQERGTSVRVTLVLCFARRQPTCGIIVLRARDIVASALANV